MTGMISTAGLSSHAMIAAASRRAVVRLDTGMTARLVGWNVRGGSGRARVEFRAGVLRTVRCEQIIEIDPSENPAQSC